MLFAEKSNFRGLIRALKRSKNCCRDDTDDQELLHQRFDGQELLKEIMHLRQHVLN
jgi:hypothetical protein